MKIKIKKLNENARIPTRGTDFAAGYDLYAAERATIYGGKNEKIHTGIAVEIPEGYFGAIYARSGLASKRSLRPANCVGIIDSDYRGEILVVLHNDRESVHVVDYPAGPDPRVVRRAPAINTDASYTVEVGERVAQLVIQKFEPIEFEEVEELSDTDRGEGGFGSTGTN